eukprot:2356483-Pleurochrysis_carterae.AAC.1
MPAPTRAPGKRAASPAPEQRAAGSQPPRRRRRASRPRRRSPPPTLPPPSRPVARVQPPLPPQVTRLNGHQRQHSHHPT